MKCFVTVYYLDDRFFTHSDILLIFRWSRDYSLSNMQNKNNRNPTFTRFYSVFLLLNILFLAIVNVSFTSQMFLNTNGYGIFFSPFARITIAQKNCFFFLNFCKTPKSNINLTDTDGNYTIVHSSINEFSGELLITI